MLAQTMKEETNRAANPGTDDPEKPLWEGTPSQWQNFLLFLSCFLILPIPFAIWKALVVKNHKITLTSQRLRVRSGVFNKHNEDVELYRVKDWTLSEPFWQRMFGKGKIMVLSSDRTAPELHLDWMPDAKGFIEEVRQAVEVVRDRKRVRELDVGADDPGFE